MAWLPPWPGVLVLMVCFLDLIQGSCQMPLHSDTCDQTIRDDASEVSAVHNVIAACQEGSIHWIHPYGALRVTFRPSGYVSGPLTLCFRAQALLTVAKISLEETSASQGSLRSLVTFNHTRSHMPREHCVQSARTITLYMEAEKDLNTTTVGRFHMEYDVQQSAVTDSKDPMEECRPCTEVELLTAVCSSDFVVSGHMESVQHSLSGEDTEIRVQASNVWRQRDVIFKQTTDYHTANMPTENAQTMTRDSSLQGMLYMPEKCGVRRGNGEFLFIGRIRLGRAMVQCAPRLQEFNTLWKRSVQMGLNPCTLD